MGVVGLRVHGTVDFHVCWVPFTVPGAFASCLAGLSVSQIRALARLRGGIRLMRKLLRLFVRV